MTPLTWPIHWLILVPLVGAAEPDDCGLQGTWGTSQADAELSGPAAYDRAGQSLDAGWDMNEDGLIDLVIGLPGQDSAGNNAGGVAVLLDATVVSGSLDTVGALILGQAASDAAGTSVASGDLDADGVGDVVVGAPGESSGGSESGAVYVVFGPVDRDTWLGDAAKMVGEHAGQHTGTAVAVAPDTDGDGADELLVGAPGALDEGKGPGTVYGVVRPSDEILDLSSADWILEAPDIAVRFGHALDRTGDLDGDGVTDLVVAAVDSEPDRPALDGVAYVFLYDQDALDERGEPVATVALTGLPQTAQLTLRVVPDLDGDDRDELFIGVPPTDDGSDTATVLRAPTDALGPGGLHQVVLGRTVSQTRELVSRGFSLSSADFDGDGLHELLVGAMLAEAPSDRTEVGWILDDPQGEELVPTDQALVTLVTDGAAGGTSWSVAAADLGSDGLAEVALAGSAAEGVGPESGVVHLLRTPPCEDLDQDGYTVDEGDCDDDDPERHPGLAEVCDDERDNDCDGMADLRDPDCEELEGEPEPRDSGEEPGEPIGPDDPEDPLRWARCEARGGGVVVTLALVPWGLFRRTWRSRFSGTLKPHPSRRTDALLPVDGPRLRR